MKNTARARASVPSSQSHHFEPLGKRKDKVFSEHDLPRLPKDNHPIDPIIASIPPSHVYHRASHQKMDSAANTPTMGRSLQKLASAVTTPSLSRSGLQLHRERHRENGDDQQQTSQRPTYHATTSPSPITHNLGALEQTLFAPQNNSASVDTRKVVSLSPSEAGLSQPVREMEDFTSQTSHPWADRAKKPQKLIDASSLKPETPPHLDEGQLIESAESESSQRNQMMPTRDDHADHADNDHADENSTSKEYSEDWEHVKPAAPAVSEFRPGSNVNAIFGKGDEVTRALDNCAPLPSQKSFAEITKQTERPSAGQRDVNDAREEPPSQAEVTRLSAGLDRSLSPPHSIINNSLHQNSGRHRNEEDTHFHSQLLNAGARKETRSGLSEFVPKSVYETAISELERENRRLQDDLTHTQRNQSYLRNADLSEQVKNLSTQLHDLKLQDDRRPFELIRQKQEWSSKSENDRTLMRELMEKVRLEAKEQAAAAAAEKTSINSESAIRVVSSAHAAPAFSASVKPLVPAVDGQLKTDRRNASRHGRMTLAHRSLSPVIWHTLQIAAQEENSLLRRQISKVKSVVYDEVFSDPLLGDTILRFMSKNSTDMVKAIENYASGMSHMALDYASHVDSEVASHSPQPVEDLNGKTQWYVTKRSLALAEKVLRHLNHQGHFLVETVNVVCRLSESQRNASHEGQMARREQQTALDALRADAAMTTQALEARLVQQEDYIQSLEASLRQAEQTEQLRAKSQDELQQKLDIAEHSHQEEVKLRELLERQREHDRLTFKEEIQTLQDQIVDLEKRPAVTHKNQHDDRSEYIKDSKSTGSSLGPKVLDLQERYEKEKLHVSKAEVLIAELREQIRGLKQQISPHVPELNRQQHDHSLDINAAKIDLATMPEFVELLQRESATAAQIAELQAVITQQIHATDKIREERQVLATALAEARRHMAESEESWRSQLDDALSARGILDADRATLQSVLQHYKEQYDRIRGTSDLPFQEEGAEHPCDFLAHWKHLELVTNNLRAQLDETHKELAAALHDRDQTSADLDASLHHVELFQQQLVSLTEQCQELERQCSVVSDREKHAVSEAQIANQKLERLSQAYVKFLQSD
ncbi:hypothetical protein CAUPRSCDRAFT_10311 [Caulochytrium protostelioides]|uniref:Uncharacterized protein n=1 Tax=Caulochytrium protostelioides TaxID=1555241 RepID=A0A4P9WZN0_9FUNG|nr:hypothetical protein CAUPRSCDRAFT_10311 [Caulochytrium protostelioides]